MRLLFFTSQIFAQANDNCGSATSLTSNAAQLCGQSIDAASTVQSGEYLGSGGFAATLANINQSD